MLEMIVKQVGINPLDGHPVLLLKEKQGGRVMPIWIGPVEMKAIAFALHEATAARPQTHDLLIKVIDACGRTISRLEITEISDMAFLAQLCLSAPGQPDIVLDCRPSDGIAIALRHEAPILVAGAVIDSAGYEDESDKAAQDAEEFKKFVDEIKASDFALLARAKGLPEAPPAAYPEHDEAGENRPVKGETINKDGTDTEPKT